MCGVYQALALFLKEKKLQKKKNYKSELRYLKREQKLQ